MKSCPNINTQEWKDLVSEYGEKAAYRMYIENGHKLPSDVADFNYDNGTMQFSEASIDQSMSKPTVFKDIVNSLAELYPDIIVNRDGIFKEDGSFLTLEEAGSKGMHYRNAFKSAVTWGQDATLDTPPHEYAHAYIDMFRNTREIQDALKVYDEETLADYMGKRYAEDFSMNKKDRSLIDAIWAKIKLVFGNPDIKERLYRSFKEGKMLGEMEAGSGIVNNQKRPPVMKKMEGYVDFNNTEVEITEDELSDLDGSFKQWVNEYDKFKPINDKMQQGIEITNDDVRPVINEMLTRGKTNGVETTTETKTVDDIIAERVIGRDNEFDYVSVFRKMIGEDVELTGDEGKFYDVIVERVKQSYHADRIKGKILLGEGRVASVYDIAQAADEEIQNTKVRKDDATGFMAKLGKYLEQHEFLNVNRLMSTLTNSVLLFGGENTVGTTFFYNQINQADSKKGELNRDWDRSYNVGGSSWSVYSAQQNRVSSVKGKDFTFETNKGSQSVTLTDAEMIGLFLVDRQKSRPLYGLSPSEDITEYGFHLEQQGLKDRNIPQSTVFKPTRKQLESINEYVLDTYPEVINSIDNTFKNVLPSVNEAHRQIHGTNIQVVDNYYPVYYGPENTLNQDSANIYNGLRSSKTRVGGSRPVMIKDVNKVMASSKAAMNHYAATAVPQYNIEKGFSALGSQYNDKSKEGKYIAQVHGQISKYLDPTIRWGSNQDKKADTFLRKLNSNFAIAVLSWNTAVMAKQCVSINTAAQYIDREFLNAVSPSLGPFTVAPLAELRKFLEWKPSEVLGKSGASFPLIWKDLGTDPVIQRMINFSGKAAERLTGAGGDRELSQAVEDERQGKDMFKLKLGNKEFNISKHRLMLGIQMVDALTVKQIWLATELETKKLYPELKEGTQEFYEHVALRWEDIVERTQPTSSSLNRVDIHSSKHMVARFMTMFGSATSKIGDAMFYEAAKTVSDPTVENKKSLLKFMSNTMFIQPLLLVAIDLLVRGLEGLDFPDEEELKDYAVPKFIGYSTGMFFGVRDVSGAVVGKIWDKPWLMETTVPPIDAYNQFKLATSQLIQGHGKAEFGYGDEYLYDDALKNYMELLLKTTGMPLKPMTMYHKLSRRFS